MATPLSSSNPKCYYFILTISPEVTNFSKLALLPREPLTLAVLSTTSLGLSVSMVTSLSVVGDDEGTLEVGLVSVVISVETLVTFLVATDLVSLGKPKIARQVYKFNIQWRKPLFSTPQDYYNKCPYYHISEVLWIQGSYLWEGII